MIYLCCCLVTKPCRLFCYSMDCSLPGFSIHGISHTRILSGLPFLSPGDLLYPGIKPTSSAMAGEFFTTEPPIKVQCCCCCCVSSIVSNSVGPRRWQPTRLPRPWDSPGKNTGVGCHFLLQCMKVKSESEVAQSSPTLSDMDCSPPGSSIHGIFQARVLEWGATAFS